MSEPINKMHGSGGGPGRLDPDGVFVVRLRVGSEPGAASGRVECVSSGQRISFESTEELLSFMLGRPGDAEDPGRAS